MSNGKIRYGASSAPCPRCDRVKSHEIQACEISNEPVKGVEAILSAVRAMRQGGDLLDDRMVGALIARTTTKVIKLVAVSGPDQIRGVHGWEAANAVVPRSRLGWMDIYGRSFNLPAEIEPGNPCAAIKLLIKLGELRNASKVKYRYRSISMYEEAVRAWEEVLDRKGRPKMRKSRKLQRYRGDDRDYILAAQSCEGCRQRLPLLLCSGYVTDVTIVDRS